MARISRGKFRYLRDLVAYAAAFAPRYFKITASNRKQWEEIMGEPLKVGERIVMRHQPLTKEMIEALG
ncbi:hypothetical protein [Pseudomonas phage D6]|nr:hypothetical protein [Pseudomonas phage D6]